ncbi:hypothetical protein Ato02nite_041950 [Paractinoplanes toevensis]|uniref:Uncharacterized protein n=1 Tax=Paractinoplanes toevensis TaxID=571911 RepID=A0A919W1F2_9ACTN|nr:hypothetical protein Ato02nite_041950 [Actinoplanes toevensis]
MRQRLAGGKVTFELCVQRFRDPRATPIEDAAVDWRSPSAPPEPIAVLTIHSGSEDSAEARKLRLNPWNTTAEFRPLGKTSTGFARPPTTPARRTATGSAGSPTSRCATG